ncbi:MAG: twin-arginine translocase TatA/TatE family subunit [Chloroflexi bacterium]|nr:twin-arginine translocase TatA/TatE family subunit [Chloroflexota bacterium]
MEILGIGFPELVFIFIIALMVFGPRRLPEIAGKAGRIVRDLRNMSQGFLAEWQREITAAARLEEIEQVRKELEETKQALRQTQTEITTGTAQIGQSINSVARPQPTSPTNSATAPKTPETTQNVDSSTIAPETTPLTETVEVTAESSEPEKSAATEAPTLAPISATESVEIPAETPEVEKNGAGSKPTPAPVAPPEVVE